MPHVYLRNGQIFREVQVPDLHRFYCIAAFGALLFTALWLNPSEESFRNLLHANKQGAVKKAFHFYKMAKSDYSYQNYLLFSTANYESRDYYGFLSKWREFPSNFPQSYDVSQIMSDDVDVVRLVWVISFIVHVAWTQAPFFLFMAKNFSGSMFNVIQGRLWCIPLSCFSHKSLSHFVGNSLSYWIVAPYAEAVVGKLNFLRLYLMGGSFSAIVSLLLKLHQSRQASLIDAVHGANGGVYALYGCLVAWTWCQGVEIAFIWHGFEMSFLRLTVTHTITDLFSPNLDLPSHLAGLAFGIMFYQTLSWET